MLSVCSHPSSVSKSPAGNAPLGGPESLVILDAQARFLQVVPPYLGEARALARSLTSNVADSEDVVQEACLRAFRGIDTFGGLNARAWLMTIVRHVAYDLRSRNRRVPEIVVDDFDDLTSDLEAPDDATTPETELELDQGHRQMEQAIQSLPCMLRKAVLLRYEQSLSYREIALAVGVPIGTVMSRLSRARRHLGTILEKMAA